MRRPWALRARRRGCSFEFTRQKLKDAAAPAVAEACGREWKANGNVALRPARLCRNGAASIRESALICAEMHAREARRRRRGGYAVAERLVRGRTLGSAAPKSGNWQSSSVDGSECLLAPEQNSEPAQSSRTLGRPGQGVAAASSPRRVTLEWCVLARCGSMANKTRSRLFGTEQKMLNIAAGVIQGACERIATSGPERFPGVLRRVKGVQAQCAT